MKHNNGKNELALLLLGWKFIAALIDFRSLQWVMHQVGLQKMLSFFRPNKERAIWQIRLTT